jgi:hypothetical protein
MSLMFASRAPPILQCAIPIYKASYSFNAGKCLLSGSAKLSSRRMLEAVFA